MIKSFRDLEVWQKAHELVLDVYRVTTEFRARAFWDYVSIAAGRGIRACQYS